jgi:hypothetical protein
MMAGRGGVHGTQLAGSGQRHSDQRAKTTVKKLIHLAFDLSFIHMEGRWRLPGSWPGRTFPDVGMYEDIARIAERAAWICFFPVTERGCRAPGEIRWSIGRKRGLGL